MNFVDQSAYEFDQTDIGWRSLDKQARYYEAATTILNFICTNRGKITRNPSLQTLYFHAGQEFASAGEEHYQKAVECFRKSLKKNPSWDWYVSGTIAFLNKDAGRIKEALDKNAQNPEILEGFVFALERNDYLYRRNY